MAHKLLKKYYKKEIQLDPTVISDILDELINDDKKMLVFGVGFDSELWYHAAKYNILFVENNLQYIELARKQNLPISVYPYENISVKNSFQLTDKQLDEFPLPLLDPPYDIILIDGPEGYAEEKPGRLLPIYWSWKYLSKKSTKIYVDDANRPLEMSAVKRFFHQENLLKYFPQREGTVKLII